jgi:iron complex transport system substrate-binding protein
MSTNLKRVAVVAAAVAMTAGLAACSAGGPGAEPTGSAAASTESAFPITIEHAFGETTVEAAPTRIATVGWASQETVIALGIVPVGMPFDSWSDDDGDGIAPWTAEALEALGGETPVLFDETDSIDFEAVASVEPDIILATYSGITEEEYATLSEIAPTIAYAGAAWSTTLDDLILINSEAIGLAAEGEALLAEIDAEIEAKVADYPQFEGKNAAYGWFDDTGTFGFYTPLDVRANFLSDQLGFGIPQAVADAAATDSFFGSISLEQIDLAEDIDIYVAYGDDATLAAALADPLYSKVPAIADGAVVLLPIAGGPLAGATSPGALATPWVLDEYLGLLAEAADKVQ